MVVESQHSKKVRATNCPPRGCSAVLREGEIRYTYGSIPTQHQYTGQKNMAAIGLYHYGARWYDPYLNRVLQADSLIPGAGKTLAWDRYAYTLNAPTR